MYDFPDRAYHPKLSLHLGIGLCCHPQPAPQGPGHPQVWIPQKCSVGCTYNLNELVTVRKESQETGEITNILCNPGLPCGSVDKESACSAGHLGSIAGLGRSPGGGNGNPVQYSCLEDSMARGDWRAPLFTGS